MKHSLRATLGAAGVLFSFVTFFIWRYGHESLGYPSFAWDYGAHIAILEEILRGHWFPDLRGQVSPHLVSAWLPIYHGIIGAHVLAWMLVKSFSLSPPVAMLVVSDLSLGLYLWVTWKFWQKCTAGAAQVLGPFLVLIVAVPMFACTSGFGFYSQSVSYGFYSVALLFLTEKKPLSALPFLLFGGFCYPDALMWILPVCVVQAWRFKTVIDLKNRAVTAVVGILFPLLLLAVQLVRLLISGGINPILSPLMALIFLVGVGIYRKWFQATDGLIQIVLLYLWAVTVVVLVSLLLTFSIEYYAAKNFYWAGLLLPLLVLQSQFQWRDSMRVGLPLILLLVGGLFVTDSRPHDQMIYIKEFIQVRSIWSNLSVRKLAAQTTTCRRAVAVDGNEVWVLAANASLGGLTLYDYNFSPPISSRYQGVRSLASAFVYRSDQVMAELKKEDNTVDCWILREAK